MRKILVIIMIGVAVPVYVYNAYMIADAGRGDNKVGGGPEKDSSVKKEIDLGNLYTGRVEFTAIEKSPFEKQITEPDPVKKKPVQRRPVKKPVRKKRPEVKKPEITVTGIMWNPSNPVAMITLPGNGSSAVKQGDTVGGIKIKEIHRNSIEIEYKGSEFTINK